MDRLLMRRCRLFDGSIQDIVADKGRIISVGRSEQVEDIDLKTMDMEERYVLPGFIDCHTHLGIIEEATGEIGMDNNETSGPVMPGLRGIDAINPFDIAFQDAVRSGITSVMSGPGSNNPVGGLNVVLKTAGTIIDRMLVKNPSGLKISLGENPMSAYGKNGKCPVTRMGTAFLIREMFLRAQDYQDRKNRNKLKERNLHLEAVLPVLEGKIMLRAHAHRADDIATAIRIADEFHIKRLVIEHGTEAHLVKEYLKEKEVAVAFGPMLTPRIKMELKKRNYGAVSELIHAGVKVAIMTDHPYNSIDQLRNVAIMAIAEGLSPEDALKCITLHPAEILDCKHELGKLEPGHHADIAVFDGYPFDINSKVVMTMIEGKVVFKRKPGE